jgi:hypothetical protein
MIDIMLKRADLKKDDVGPLKLYELYISLREIIVNAKGIEHELDRTVNDLSNARRIKYQIEAQQHRLVIFCDVLWELIHYIEIFDRDVHRELGKIVGMKFTVLRSYERAFCRLQGEKLTLRERKESESLENIVRCSGKQPDDLYLKDYDLTNLKDVTLLRDQARQNITTMEETLQKLGDFIKSNCELKDLFPSQLFPR